MKLCYYHDNEGNFGDDLNAWLWPKLLPGVIQGIAKHGEEYYEENNPVSYTHLTLPTNREV